MADGRKGGVVAALGMALAGEAGAPEAEAEQLDLLGLPAKGGGTSAVASRGAGRPAGSMNRRTEQWADYLAKRYGHPLEVLAQIAVAETDALARSLGCKPLEALQEKRHAATALLPYVASRQPIAVNLTGRQVIHLTIETGDEGEAVAIAENAEVVEFQEVSEGAGDDV